MGMNHPVTGKPFNYERCCNTCQHFSDRTRRSRGVTYRTTKCALDPEQRNLNDTAGVAWKSMPACSQHKPKTS